MFASSRLIRYLKDYFVITVTCLLYAFAFNCFFQPNELAMGGFTGIVAFVLLFAIVLGPAVLTDSNFSAVPAITDKLSFYRAYLTAFLQGDDVVLDDLEYARNASNFAPRNTDAEKKEFLEIPVMRLETSYPADVYLTGWIATEYRDGAWYTANYNGEDYNKYRGLYSAIYDRTSTPYEDVFFSFMNTYLPYDMHTVAFETTTFT